MTLRMPLAAMLCALLAIALLGAVGARQASAHTVPVSDTAYEVSEPVTGPAQIMSPTEEGTGSMAWVWLGVAAFILFAALGGLLAVFGYLESTRRN